MPYYTKGFTPRSDWVKGVYFDEHLNEMWISFSNGTYLYKNARLQDFDNIERSLCIENAVKYFDSVRVPSFQGVYRAAEFKIRPTNQEPKVIYYTDCYFPVSSAIEAVYYESTLETMYVMYVGKSTYQYDNVPLNEFQTIVEAESAGKAVNDFKSANRGKYAGDYIGEMFREDFRSVKQDSRGPDLRLVPENGKTENITNVFYINDYSKPKEVFEIGDALKYVVEFKTTVTGDKRFEHSVYADSVEDAMNRLEVVADALSTVLTILSVKVIYERD